MGYNMGFGPRHALDLSWRRATSTPTSGRRFATSPKSYIADQYSIVLDSLLEGIDRVELEIAPAFDRTIAGLEYCPPVGGGGGETPADILPGQKAEPPTTGPNLVSVSNPQNRRTALETNTAAYTNAYYEAIGRTTSAIRRPSTNRRTALQRHGTKEITVIFGDQRDQATAGACGAQNPDGTIAFFVENYLIQVARAINILFYQPEAAIVRDTKWLVGINAIEFTPVRMAAYLSRSSTTTSPPPSSARPLSISMDAAARPCPAPASVVTAGAAMHSCRPTPTASANSILCKTASSLQRGDVQAAPSVRAGRVRVLDHRRLQRAGDRKPDQDHQHLDSVRLSLHGTSTAPEDQCRRPAGASEMARTASGSDQGGLRRKRPAARQLGRHLCAAGLGVRWAIVFVSGRGGDVLPHLPLAARYHPARRHFVSKLRQVRGLSIASRAGT